MAADAARIARIVVARHGTTFTDQAGIRLADKPSPLWCLLVMSLVCSARIKADLALGATRELWAAGWRTPQRLAASTTRQRVDALGRGGYRRYDERTADQLGALARTVLDRYRGDLRRLHAESPDLLRDLQQFSGIGPTGAGIFCRDVQVVWTDLAPYVDPVAAKGADRLGLPRDAGRLAELVSRADFPRLLAGCVRAALDKSVVVDVRTETGGGPARS